MVSWLILGASKALLASARSAEIMEDEHLSISDYVSMAASDVTLLALGLAVVYAAVGGNGTRSKQSKVGAHPAPWARKEHQQGNSGAVPPWNRRERGAVANDASPPLPRARWESSPTEKAGADMWEPRPCTMPDTATNGGSLGTPWRPRGPPVSAGGGGDWRAGAQGAEWLSRTDERGPSENAKLNQRIIEAQSSDEVLEIVNAVPKSGFNAVNLATAVHRIAKWCKGQQEAVPEILEDAGFVRITTLVRLRLHDFKLREVGNLIWALAVLRYRGPLVEKLADLVESRIHEFKTQELANTLWAAATLKLDRPSFLRSLQRESVTKLPEFTSAPELTNLVWAWATLGLKDEAFFRDSGTMLTHASQALNPQGLATVAWSFATAGMQCPKLFEAIRSRASTLLRYFKPQDIANIAWSFATLEIADDEFFTLLGDTVERRAEDFNGAALANTAWAFATAGHSHSSTGTVGRCAVLAAPSMTGDSVAKMSWALAMLGRFSDDVLFEALAQRAIALRDTMLPTEIAGVCWAFAERELKEASSSTPALFAGLATTIVRRAGEFEGAAAASVAWGFASVTCDGPLGMACREVVEALVASSAWVEADSSVACKLVWAVQASKAEVQGAAGAALEAACGGEALVSKSRAATAQSFSKVR